MELGVHFIDFLPDGPEKLGPTLAGAAKAAEDGGVTMFTLADHFFQMEGVGRAQDPFLEGYTALGFLAGQTEKITLTMLVTGVTYRHPGVLAKIVATLDVLSQGRSMFGVGAAWYEREHVALGIPFPPVRERFEMLEETIQICQQMWSDNDGPYRGKHYQLAETICGPQPIRRPPILIGGGGEKKTLRLVAQYADVWNSTASTVDELKHKIDVLDRHCETVAGTPPRSARPRAYSVTRSRISTGTEDGRKLRRTGHRFDQCRSFAGQSGPRRVRPPPRRRGGAQKWLRSAEH